MPHLADEKALRKPGQKKKDNPVSIEQASTETGGQLREHTLEDVELSLRVLAYNGSNYSRSSIQLKDEFGIDVHSQTLRRWANTHFPRKYALIQKDLDKEIGDKLSGRLTDVALKGTELQDELLDDLNEQKGELEPREIAIALRNVSQAVVPAIEKSQLLRGKPERRTEVKDSDQLIAKLVQLGVVKNPEALDIEDAIVVDSTESGDQDKSNQ